VKRQRKILGIRWYDDARNTKVSSATGLIRASERLARGRGTPCLDVLRGFEMTLPCCAESLCVLTDQLIRLGSTQPAGRAPSEYIISSVVTTIPLSRISGDRPLSGVTREQRCDPRRRPVNNDDDDGHE